MCDRNCGCKERRKAERVRVQPNMAWPVDSRISHEGMQLVLDLLPFALRDGELGIKALKPRLTQKQLAALYHLHREAIRLTRMP